MLVFSTTITSPLGPMHILADEQGIRVASFTTVVLQEPVNSNAPKHLLDCELQLAEYFAGTRNQFDLPISQKGTPFQEKVWQALLHIPYGRTVSYMELSKRIGDVKAIRAVGTTNGKNQVAIIVPCHRVIGSNGDLTGYAGELWRKRWLLEHEAKWSGGVQTLF